MRRKPSTTVSFMRNGCPCLLVSTAATKGVLPGAPRTALAAASLAAEIGVIELDPPAERVARGRAPSSPASACV